MNNGEVKRWQAPHMMRYRLPAERESETDHATEAYALPCSVVLASDHDRIMAERDELWKRATKFVMPGEMDTGESIEHYIKTLEATTARQARVIEKLREQRDIELEDNCLDDALTGGRPFEQDRKMMDEEIEAMNKLEDLKKL